MTDMITREEVGSRLANVAGKAWSDGQVPLAGSKTLFWTPIEGVAKAILAELDAIVKENPGIIIFKDCVLTQSSDD